MTLAEAAVTTFASRAPLGPTPGVGYIRVSKEREGMVSPDLQQHAITEFARRQGVYIAPCQGHEPHPDLCAEECSWVFDLDRSGRDFTKRQVGRVIDGVRAGRWAVVLLWKWSRWGRNMQQSMVYLAKCEEAGGTVRAATEDFDTKTAFGKFSRGQFLLLAELDSDMKSEGWREAQDRRRRGGLPHTGTHFFGYTYSRQPEPAYTVNRAEADLLADAYRAFVGGASLYSIAQRWNALGVRTRTNRLWNPTNLGRMLDTGFAAGLIRERSNPGKAGTNARTLASFDKWRPGAHDAVIPPGTWDAYKAMRLANAKAAPRTVRRTHTLSGLVVCRECGKRLTSVYSGKHTKHTWSCRGRQDGVHGPVTLSNARLEAVVLAWFAELAGQTDAETVERLAQVERDRQANAASDTAALKAEVKRLTAKRENLVDLVSDGVISRDDYTRRHDQTVADLAEADAALRQAESNAKATPPARAEFRGVLVAWDGATVEERGRLLRRAVSAVVVSGGRFGDDPHKVTVVGRWETRGE